MVAEIWESVISSFVDQLVALNELLSPDPNPDEDYLAGELSHFILF